MSDDQPSSTENKNEQPVTPEVVALGAPAVPAKLKKQLRDAVALAAKTAAKSAPIVGAKPAAQAENTAVPEHLAGKTVGDVLSAAAASAVAPAQPDLEQVADTADATQAKTQAATGEETPESTASTAEEATEKLLEDPKTDKAVDEILEQEADKVLAAEDEARDAIALPPRTGWRKFTGFFAAWWSNKWARWITIFLILAAITAVTAIPKTRYFVLNTAGVRSSVTLTALDDTTQLPLKNVTVSLGDYQAKTNSKGVAVVQKVKLGTYQMTVQRLAFASAKQSVTVGWGSNQLGKFPLHATGLQYTITVVDYVSGKPIAGAEAADGDATAQSDKTGKIILTVATPPAAGLPVTVSATGYRSEQRTIPTTATAPTAIALVSSQKEVYVSRQSGTYGVYASDIDNQNKKLLLAGTGLETSNLQLATSSDGQRAALVSTRDNVRDSDGYLLSALTLVNTANGTPNTIEHAEQIQLIDWTGSKLIYETVVAGASAANPQRERIFSYDYKTSARVQLAAANQFNVAVSAGGVVYYANSSTDTSATVGLYKISPDGSARQQILGKEIWSAFRTDYNTLALQTPAGWYNYTFGGHAVTAQPPTQYGSRQFTENASATRSLWVDNRDGKGVLLVHDDATGKDTIVASEDAMAYPVRWLSDDLVVFRIAAAHETADYVVSLSGGAPKKITDVTNAYSFAQGF